MKADQGRLPMKEITWVHILLTFVVLFLIGIAVLVPIHAANRLARMQPEEQCDFDNYIFINPEGSTINTRYLDLKLMEFDTVVDEITC